MTDLLVWSLMADGGLETAFFEALRSEIAELADADETFEIPTTYTTIPLLHLIKQLLRYLLCKVVWFIKFLFIYHIEMEAF